MNLRMVDRYFYKLIKPLSYEEGLEVEKSHFALQNDIFVCSSCLRLRRKEKFVEAKILIKSDGTRLHLFGDRSRTLPVPYCIDCGYGQELPRCRLGDIIANESMPTMLSQIFCNGCEDFPELNQRKILSMCEKCWQEPSARLRPKLEDTDFRGYHMSKHCHHSIMCETCLDLFAGCHWVQRLNKLVRFQPGDQGTQRLTSMSELKVSNSL